MFALSFTPPSSCLCFACILTLRHLQRRQVPSLGLLPHRRCKLPKAPLIKPSRRHVFGQLRHLSQYLWINVPVGHFVVIRHMLGGSRCCIRSMAMTLLRHELAKVEIFPQNCRTGTIVGFDKRLERCAISHEPNGRLLSGQFVCTAIFLVRGGYAIRVVFEGQLLEPILHFGI